MEVTTDLSEKIVDVIQEAFLFFANQELSFYASILMLIVFCSFAIVYITQSISLIKKCYKDIDNIGFRKVNIMNLISVILFLMIHPDLPLLCNVYLGVFAIPVLVWILFMLKLFILNLKRYKTKKNFVKNKKKKATVEKQIGAGHRISRNDLTGIYQSAGESYKDCSPLEGQEINRQRLNNDILFNRKG